MTESVDLLKALPRYETAHAALLVDILDVVQGSFTEVRDRPIVPPLQELTGTELRVLRFLPTNLSSSEIAREIPIPVCLSQPSAQAAALRHSINAPSRCERAARASTPETASAPTVWSRWAKRVRRVPRH